MSSKFTWSSLKSLWKQAMQGMRIRRHLPPEYAKAFEEFKDIKSIDRIQTASWIGFVLAVILIFGLDNYRSAIGEFKENPYNYTLFYFHIVMLFFLVPAIYIGKRKAWIIQTRLRRGIVIWGMVVFCFIAMLAHGATVYYYRDSLNIFIGFIFSASWMFAMSHRERLLFFSVSLSVMGFFILKKEFDDHNNQTLVNAIEVTFFSIIAFFFDAFDYNLRVTNFLNQRQIESEQKRIRELEAFKARFFTNLTHEFRTPLTIIIGMAREIADQPNRWAAEGSQMIRHHAGNLLNLINQILDLSRIENSSMPLKMVQSDIIPFISVIVDAYKGQAVLKGITVHFLPPPQPIVMDFDPDKMVTIVANLLSNAIKFTPEDGNIYVSVYLQRLESHEEQLSIVIKDSGIGIPAEELEHIFERFYQVPGELSKAGMGNGIGLALSMELAQLLGGDIAVTSTMGKGSQFTIHLPVNRNATITSVMAPVVEDNIVQQINPHHVIIPGAEESDFIKPELLIIEDHADIVAYLQICLRDMFSISVSRNGEEGIQKALEIVPSIIISDVLMPVKDGLAVCRELKGNSITSHIPIMLLSAKTDTASRIAGLESGADLYMLKPFDKDELRVQMRNLLDRYTRFHTRYENPIHIAQGEKPEEVREDEFITRVRKVIVDRLDDSEFSVFDLERGVFLSRSQLHKKLKALTGMSATQFINRVRLTAARDLLKDESLSISDIAYRVGYTDPNYFTRIFVESFGETPSDTRKAHKVSAL